MTLRHAGTQGAPRMVAPRGTLALGPKGTQRRQVRVAPLFAASRCCIVTKPRRKDALLATPKKRADSAFVLLH